jgi:hypothetical protein
MSIMASPGAAARVQSGCWRAKVSPSTTAANAIAMTNNTHAWTIQTSSAAFTSHSATPD